MNATYFRAVPVMRSNVGGCTFTDVVMDKRNMDVWVKLEKGDYIYMCCREKKKNTKHVSRVALVTVSTVIEFVPLSEKCLHALLLLSFPDHSSSNVGKFHSHVTWFVNRKLKRPILGAVWSYLSSLLAKTMPCFPRGSDQSNSNMSASVISSRKSKKLQIRTSYLLYRSMTPNDTGWKLI